MAITATNLTTGTDIDGGSGSVSASISPIPNTLNLLTLVQRTEISADPNTPTATGNGLTWTVVKSVVFDIDSASRRRITVLRAMNFSPLVGAVSMDFGGQAHTNVSWSIDRFTGVAITGNNGADAIVQSVSNLNAAASSLTVTLASFSNINNATFGAFSIDSNVAPTMGSGFTQVGYIESGNTLSCVTEFKKGNDTTVDMTFNVTGVCGGIAIELRPYQSPIKLNNLRPAIFRPGIAR